MKTDKSPSVGNSLPFQHPTHLRRLARELNSAADGSGIYTGGRRFTRARFSKGSLHLREGSGPWERLEVVSDTQFSDGYGRSVVASRKPNVG